MANRYLWFRIPQFVFLRPGSSFGMAEKHKLRNSKICLRAYFVWYIKKLLATIKFCLVTEGGGATFQEMEDLMLSWSNIGVPVQDVQVVGPEVFLNVPVFRQTSAAGRARLAECGCVRRLNRGERVFRIGDPVEKLAIVLDGRIQCGRENRGRPWVSTITEVGGVVSLAGCLVGGNWPAGAIALTAASVVEIPRDVFMTLIHEDRELVEALLLAVAREALDAEAMCAAFALQTPEQRVAAFLIGLVGESDSAVLPDTQARLAAQLGTVRECFGRAMRSLVDKGVITRSGIYGKSFRIINREYLELLAS